MTPLARRRLLAVLLLATLVAVVLDLSGSGLPGRARSVAAAAIVDAVRATLDKTPPELAGDIVDRGIVLTGGGALLKGMDDRLRHETGIPIHVADNPLDAVVLGAGKCVDNLDTLQRILVTDRRR